VTTCYLKTYVISIFKNSNTQYDIDNKWHTTWLCRWVVHCLHIRQHGGLLEIGKSAVKSGKQRINNLWPDRFVDEKKKWRSKQRIYHNNANVCELWPWKRECVTLGEFLDDICSGIRWETLFSVCILYLVNIIFCTQSAVCSLHFTLTGSTPSPVCLRLIPLGFVCG